MELLTATCKSSCQVVQRRGSTGQIAIGIRTTYLMPVIKVRLTSKYSQLKSIEISQDNKHRGLEQERKVSSPFNGSLVVVINA